MARTVRSKPTLATTYRTATGPRTVPLTDPQGHRLQWPIEIGGIDVYSRDASSVIFIPSCRFWTDGEEDDDPDASWREESQAFNCFKTSYAYNMIGEEHPRIVPILGQDAWTGLPILPKPSGGSLENFLERHGDQLYAPRADVSSPPTRIKPEFLPLAYQWSLQLLSALSFIHSHDIAYGELLDTNCWISEPSLSIALAGFLGSDFSDSASGRNLPGIFFSGYEFSPASLPSERAINVPTAQTDMFMFGRLVHEIMTSYIPGYGIGRDWGETARLMREQDWLPNLEDEFMGGILHKCWKFEYEEVEELQSEVQSFVQSRGWAIRGDELEDLDVDSIRRQLEVRE